jgi:hypothetical protein
MSCAIARPLSGPGFNSTLNKINGDPERTVVVAITNAYLDRSKRKSFDSKTQSIYKNLDTYSGYIAGSMRLKLLGKEVWTYTVWENEAALKNFVNAREHVDAMYTTDEAIKSMRSLHMNIAAKDVPTTWKQIEKIIETKEMKPYKPL